MPTRIRPPRAVLASIVGLSAVLGGTVGVTQCAGCAWLGPVEYAPGPRTDYLNASNGVKDLIALLNAAHTDGLLSDETWVETVNPAIQETSAAMDAWEAAVLSGRAEEIGTARVLAEALIAQLRTHLAQASVRGGDS